MVRLRRALAALALALGLAGAPAGAQFANWTAPPSIAPPLTSAAQYTSICGRLGFPITAAAMPGISSNLTSIHCASPTYAVSNIRLLFVNFYVAQTGVDDPEACPGNPRTIDFATLFVGATPYVVKFSGQTSATIADCGFVLSDPLRDGADALVSLPAATEFDIRSSQTAPDGGVQLFGRGSLVQPMFTNATVGDGVGNYPTPQTQLAASGSVPAYHNGSMASGPAMALGTGWDGSPAYWIAGDSIGWGENDWDAAAPAIGGYLGRALNDSATGRRNFYSFAFNGTRPEIETAAGRMKLRLAAIAAIGNLPFNVVLSEMGQNSTQLGGSSPSLANFQAAMWPWWEMWHAICPACLVIQTTFPSHQSQSNNTWFTDQADQVAGDYPNGVRWQFDAWCPAASGLPAWLRCVDTTTAFTTGSGFADNPGNWPTTGWSGTLTNAVSSGMSVQVTAASAPAAGADLVIDPGQSDVERLPIASVSGAASPWTVALAANVANAHAAGTAVGTALTIDGTHPASPLYKAVAAALAALKGTTLP